MTALQILNLLKSTRDRHNCAVLWLNDRRRVAAVHDGEIAHDVDYDEALIAIGDPNLNLIDRTDGESWAA